MYRVGVVLGKGLVNWFCMRESLQDCLDTIAYNQLLDYDACEFHEYVYEEVVDESV